MRRSEVDQRVAVELVEDADDDDAGPWAAPTGRARSPERRRGWRGAVRRWWWIAGIAAVALLLMDGAADRREQEALARYAGLPGVLGSLEQPVEARWRMHATDQIWAVGDVVVSAADDAASVVARDPATGRVRWWAPLPERIRPPARCALGVGSASEAGEIPAAGSGGGRAGAAVEGTAYLGPGVQGGAMRTGVVCEVHAATGVGETGATVFGVLDSATGTLVRQVTAPRAWASTVVDGDLVVVEQDDDGLVVTRHDVVGGRAVWRTALPGVVPGPEGVRLTAGPDVVAVEARESVVLASGDGGEVGRWVPVDDPLALFTARVVIRPGEGFGVWTSRFSGRWHAPDGSQGPRLHGAPTDPAVIDTSTPGVALLTSADGDLLRAVEVTTGRERWSRPAPSRVLLRLGGRVVMVAAGRLESVETATGELRWSVPLDIGDRPEAGAVMTDGVRVLVPGRAADGQPRLTAYALADGRRSWREPLPPGGSTVLVLGDHLVAVGVRGGDDDSPDLTVLG
jgi:outer membrane protein assembly factor BamB